MKLRICLTCRACVVLVWCQVTLHLPARSQTVPTITIEKDYEFRLPATRMLPNGTTLGFEHLKGKAIVITHQNAEITRIRFPEVIQDIVQSDDGKKLLLLLFRMRETGGADYAAVGLIKLSNDGRVSYSMHLPAETNIFEAKQKWVAEVGAIANDGKRALLRISAASRPIAPFSVQRTWQVWDIVGEKIVVKSIGELLK